MEHVAYKIFYFSLGKIMQDDTRKLGPWTRRDEDRDDGLSHLGRCFEREA